MTFAIGSAKPVVILPAADTAPINAETSARSLLKLLLNVLLVVQSTSVTPPPGCTTTWVDAPPFFRISLGLGVLKYGLSFSAAKTEPTGIDDNKTKELNITTANFFKNS